MQRLRLFLRLLLVFMDLSNSGSSALKVAFSPSTFCGKDYVNENDNDSMKKKL